jgi:hypothetical protein
VGIDTPVSNQQGGASVIGKEAEFVNAEWVWLPPAPLIGHGANRPSTRELVGLAWAGVVFGVSFS